MPILHDLVTLLVVIDPLAIVPFFITLTRGASAGERARIALLATSIAAGVLLVFALLGEVLLELLGIGMAAFRIAGGVLLFLLAIDMLFARPMSLRAVATPNDAAGAPHHDVAVFPLAIPMIAGPGAIATVVLLMGRAEAWWPDKLTVVLLTAFVVLLTGLSLRASERLYRLFGSTGNTVLGRVLGILLAAMAAQFVIDGARMAAAGVG